MDPDSDPDLHTDPALIVIDLQDSNKKPILKKSFFYFVPTF
jgi:hypothetical protein